MGVRKAMDTVLEAARGTKVTYTIGPLIHNPHALKMLESRNVYVADEIGGHLRGETVVLRAHGITLDHRRRLEEIGAKIVDATCPNVVRSQNIIAKYHAEGAAVVIVGDRGHAEIESLLSYTDGAGIVVETLDEARALPRFESVCVVAQTTFNREQYTRIAGEIAAHAGECTVANTVCASTDRRQADIRKLAEETDATVVVGGRNSANTMRLAEISRELGQPTFLIEDPDELDLEALSKYEVIGLTAGASTPSWLIRQVYDSIAGYTPGSGRVFGGLARNFAFIAAEGNVVVCAAAAMFTVAVNRLMDIPANVLFPVLTFFYLLPLHTVNQFLELNWKQINTTRQAPRLRRYWGISLVLSLTAGLISLILAWQLEPFAFSFMAASYLLGGLYSVRILPVSWRTRYKSLRDIPGSKDIVIALAWTFAMVAVPRISIGTSPTLLDAAAAVFVFVPVLSRTSLLAIGSMQSDRLIGHETIPVLLSRTNTLRLLNTANVLLAAMFLLLAGTGAVRPTYLVLAAAPVYMLVSIRLLSKEDIFFTFYHQLMLDAGFFLSGLIAGLFL